MEHKYKNKMTYFTLALYVILYYIFIIFFKNENQYFNIVSVLFSAIPLFIAVIIMIRLNAQDEKKSIILKAICISTLVNFIGQCFEIYHKIILKDTLSNYVMIDTASAVSALILFTALINKFYKKKDKRSTVVLTIDVLTIMCVSAAITWIYIISPKVFSISGINSYEMILYIIYPILHLAILSVSVILYKSIDGGDPEKKSILMIVLAFIVIYTGNLVYSRLLFSGTYATGSFIDPLWTIYDLLIVLAAIEYSRSKKIDWDDVSKDNSAKVELRGILPVISTVALLVLVYQTSYRVAWICFAINILLINTRQYVIKEQKQDLIKQLEELNINLENKIDERTKEIYEIASSDHLTGLINRRRFEEIAKDMIKQSKEKNTKISLILIDLDRFKAINDNYGHSFGDLLIKEFAKILKGIADDRSVVSRQGGDEFAIISNELSDSTYPKTLAEKILKKLISPIVLNGQRIYTTCSIGISIYPKDGKTYEDIIRCSDLAMYHSKSLGRNTYSFYGEDMIKLNTSRMTFERELHKAIEKNEFVLHYQPQIDISSNKVIGLEALIRWNHPSQGLISPFHFIRIAEDIGLIGDIGEWVIDTACSQMKKWHEKGFNKVKIGVNISPYQFQQDNFVDMVRSTLMKSRLNPKYLDLEITESVAMKNEIAVITKLKKLKKLGVQVSMDDFGTGYSSLSYLRRLPIDTLKIPREFIKEIKPYEDKKNIIEAIIAIAQKLDLAIIAEGVESEIQLNFLKDKNCKLIQGYLFSKPLLENKVENFLKEYS